MPSAAEREISATMLVAVAQRRPELARSLARTALTPRQIAEVLKSADAQERAGGCEFSRAFPDLARAAVVAESEADEDPSVRPYLARMRRLDEALVAEERELGRRLRQHGR